MIVDSSAFNNATSLPGLNARWCSAWRDNVWRRGSMTISFAPRSLTAFLMNVAATG